MAISDDWVANHFDHLSPGAWSIYARPTQC